MLSLPVPDYFQEQDEAALRSQVGWLEQHLGLGDRFFARLLRVEEDTFHGWKVVAADLPPDRRITYETSGARPCTCSRS